MKSLKVSLKDILEVLDGYTTFNKCVIVMTTNNKKKLDPALIRPGRIDLDLEYNNASCYQIGKILEAANLTDLKIYTCPGKITTSRLINSIILPNINNKKKIMEEFKSVFLKN